MQIRLAALTDIPAILQLIKEVVPVMQATGNFQWDHTYPNLQVFEKDISLNQLWLVEIDGSIAGVAAITQDQSPEYVDAGWDITQPAIVVHRLAVSPRYQGKGVAAALMCKAEEVAVSEQISIMRIDTNSKNQATQKLFPKLGYAYAGEISLAFRDGLRFYCYKKLL